MIETAVALFLAHVLADFVFQPARMARAKRNPLVLLLHGVIVTALSLLAVGHDWTPAVLALGLAHVAIDGIKAHAPGGRGAGGFLADQAAHLVTIAAVAAASPDLWQTGAWARQAIVPHAVVLHGMLIIGGGVYAIRAGGLVVGQLMARFGEGFASAGLPDGGAVIGLLERGLIFLLILFGQAGSIGFLIAAKSVMRFETASKEQKAAEYVIIGTLASFAWAIAITMIVIAVRDLLPELEIARVDVKY